MQTKCSANKTIVDSNIHSKSHQIYTEIYMAFIPMHCIFCCYPFTLQQFQASIGPKEKLNSNFIANNRYTHRFECLNNKQKLYIESKKWMHFLFIVTVGNFKATDFQFTIHSCSIHAQLIQVYEIFYAISNSPKTKTWRAHAFTVSLCGGSISKKL